MQVKTKAHSHSVGGGGAALDGFRQKESRGELQQEVIVVKDAGRVREVGGGRGREMERKDAQK